MDGNATVSRIGADEFAVLLPLTFSEDAALERAGGGGAMLIEVLSAPYDVGARMARLSASVGCSLYSAGDDTTEVLLSKAESALYHAKHSGRGVVHRLHPRNGRGRQARHPHRAGAAPCGCGQRGRSRYFQPIVDLETRRLIGFEALARWTDPDLGSISPAVFIPIAEDRGIIGPLSQLLLRKAAEAARTWPDELFLSFNLSPSQLGGPEHRLADPVDAGGRPGSTRAGWRSRSPRPAS